MVTAVIFWGDVSYHHGKGFHESQHAFAGIPQVLNILLGFYMSLGEAMTVIW